MPVILAHLFDTQVLEAWARANAEPATYAAFFGLLAVFGVLEVLVGRTRRPAQRSERWVVNFALAASWIATSALIPLSMLAVADAVRDRGWGLMNLAPIDPLAGLVLGILARSLISYGTHLVMHRVPIFWRIHRVHHFDTHLDISSTARFHPFEALASAPIGLAAVALLGVPPSAVLIYEVLDAAIVVFTHANLRLPEPVDRALRLVIVTPDMHRIHHSARQPQTDSNFGATFSFWDRLFGTYRRASAEELASLELGLETVRDARARQFWWLLASPFLSPRPDRTDDGRQA